MPEATILIVEDDPSMLEGLRDNFGYEGYCVRTADDGEEGLEAALDGRPDLIVLDIMLPKINGYEVCRVLRERGVDVPIVMLTAKGQESDIVLGLEVGADDYVTKPFGIMELLARVKALLRRCMPTGSQTRCLGDVKVDLKARSVSRDGEEIHLTPKEFGVLEFLLERPGHALTRNQILNAVWGHSVFVTPRSVDQCINTLRAKTESSGAQFIKTLRGVGYRLDLPEQD